eukprot:COSAG06_NODE_2380_length_6981_cov_38.221738_1_plen_800_part_00
MTSARDEALLQRLGDGEPLSTIAESQGWSIDQMKAWFVRVAAKRGAPFLQVFSPSRGRVPTEHDVRIERDEQGLPHIMAETDSDLFFGFGWAMSEDRLFQLDYLRRKALGKLSEIVGSQELCVSILSDNRAPTSALELDKLARTVGFGRIAAAQWPSMEPAAQALLSNFCDGVNAQLAAATKERSLPVECSILNYTPNEFSPQDMLAIETDFRWYLTGRFNVLLLPELAAEQLQGDLLDDWLLGEADDEAILPEGVYEPLPPSLVPDPGAGLTAEPVSGAVGFDPDAVVGSNNWACTGELTSSGGCMVGSDPHVGFEAVSCWYNVHLHGGSYDVVGCAYVGVPAIMFGRNQNVAWGITNNICSQRDLFWETANEEGQFLHDGAWIEPTVVSEVIYDKNGEEALVLPVIISRHGPIVNDVLPAAAAALTTRVQQHPIALQWVAAYGDGWLEAMLSMDRATSVAEFRESLRPWHCPSFNLSVADTHGSIGMVSVGRLPLRGGMTTRGLRDGSSSANDWVGFVPYDAMPHAIDPPSRTWLGSANNRLTDDNYPYPLGGTFASGFRGLRIRQLFEEAASHGGGLTVSDMAAMQMDTLSLPACEDLPVLQTLLSDKLLSENSATATARSALLAWDGDAKVESTGTLVYRFFMSAWTLAVASARFSPDTAPLLAVEPLARRLLVADPKQWFADEEERIQAVHAAFGSAVENIVDTLGSDPSEWSWGRLHVMPLRHVLSALGDGSIAELVNATPRPIGGDMTTLGNTGQGVFCLVLHSVIVVLIAKSPAWAPMSRTSSCSPVQSAC